MANAIITENLNTGATGWKPQSAANNFIQAYCDQVSYNTGDTVTFFVSTQTAGTSYSFTVYRLGYYQGLGGCIKYTSGTLTGVAQGYWDGTTLQNCPTAIIDNTTHNCEAGWTSSTTWSIPSNACTGIYTAQFKDSSNRTMAVVFVVSGNAGADYCVVRPFMTDAAYNPWGGYSLYTAVQVGVEVSFNRPNYFFGGSEFFAYEVNFIQWIEQQGYNLTYYSDIDIHNNVSLLLNSKVILSMGHDEYWTYARRNGWEAAIAAGVSAAFLGANASYWQARLTTDNAGNANRSVICYKVLTSDGSLHLDPYYGVNNAQVTSQWRDPVLNRPENTMIGIMYSGVNSSGNTPWTTDTSMDTTYTPGTGLVANTGYGTDIVGYEWDNIHSNSPAGLKTIATSSTPGAGDTSNTTWYRANSGALIFATGSIAWAQCLNNYRWTATQGTGVGVSGMQVLMANIMGALKGPVFSMVKV